MPLRQGMSESVCADDLRIAALTPFTTLDFPGRLSAVVFVRGCPWKCVYCHNCWMQSRQPHPSDIPFQKVVDLLDRRQGLLDAVVFSGGEPCLDPALRQAMLEVKRRGMMVALHTAGIYPQHLAGVIDLIDWVGLDVKAPPTQPEVYARVVGAPHAAQAVIESFDLIAKSGVAYEVRTTAHPDFLTNEQIREIGTWLAERGTEHFALQIYRRPPGQTQDVLDNVDALYPSERTLAALRAQFKHFQLRRA